MQSSSTRPSATTRHKGKEIAKLVTPQSESVFEEDSDPEQARRDKDFQKNLGTPCKVFQEAVQTYQQQPSRLLQTPRTRTRQRYHTKEKMMMCKHAEKGDPLHAEQADWLEDTDERLNETRLEAHYSYMAKFQDVLT
ncbi:hypothetical protein Tco_1263192 [Tanacetum coccineum]